MIKKCPLKRNPFEMNQRKKGFLNKYIEILKTIIEIISGGNVSDMKKGCDINGNRTKKQSSWERNRNL